MFSSLRVSSDGAVPRLVEALCFGILQLNGGKTYLNRVWKDNALVLTQKLDSAAADALRSQGFQPVVADFIVESGVAGRAVDVETVSAARSSKEILHLQTNLWFPLEGRCVWDQQRILLDPETQVQTPPVFLHIVKQGVALTQGTLLCYDPAKTPDQNTNELMRRCRWYITEIRNENFRKAHQLGITTANARWLVRTIRKEELCDPLDTKYPLLHLPLNENAEDGPPSAAKGAVLFLQIRGAKKRAYAVHLGLLLGLEFAASLADKRTTVIVTDEVSVATTGPPRVGLRWLEENVWNWQFYDRSPEKYPPNLPLMSAGDIVDAMEREMSIWSVQDLVE
ncbi:hypothetical protein MKEN_00826700 [Mycena kentingensis (nom. inval.)]|nr:hypothetical protein MKEN_00826700 [Mycena kentingensis (nom. inval.)]